MSEMCEPCVYVAATCNESALLSCDADAPYKVSEDGDYSDLCK